jgi:hypothetical protein
VKESAVVKEWKAESKAEDLRDVLEARFGPVPADLMTKIAATRVGEVLRGWLILAARAASLEQFRQEAGI